MTLDKLNALIYGSTPSNFSYSLIYSRISQYLYLCMFSIFISLLSCLFLSLSPSLSLFLSVYLILCPLTHLILISNQEYWAILKIGHFASVFFFELRISFILKFIKALPFFWNNIKRYSLMFSFPFWYFHSILFNFLPQFTVFTRWGI